MDDIVLLLAEDEPLIAMMIEEALREGGYSVHHVMSGDDAIAVLESGVPVVAGVVTDIQMGSPDGWTVARRARELVPHIPVIYVSGDSAHEHSAHGVPDSVMMQKPFASAQLVTAISMLMNGTAPEPN